MKRLRLITKILIVAFVVGLSLLLYPSFSNFWNSKHSTRAVNEYASQLESISLAEYENIWASAVEYNQDLLLRPNKFILPSEMKIRYEHELNVSGSGLIGYVDIPAIGVLLPIYHGTSESVLQYGIGHLEWSSLPTGGESTHCVLSGHRGLPSAKLFTDLNKLREGDLFTLNILDEVLTYEVDQIRTVLPNELAELAISENYDYCTLVTCTPYGINTHRLLVRGYRIANTMSATTIISEAVLVDQVIVAIYLATPLILILFMIVMLKRPRKNPASITLREEYL